jgi:hypothetical protein
MSHNVVYPAPRQVTAIRATRSDPPESLAAPESGNPSMGQKKEAIREYQLSPNGLLSLQSLVDLWASFPRHFSQPTVYNRSAAGP